jgi:hypothetical protein
MEFENVKMLGKKRKDEIKVGKFSIKEKMINI